MHINDLHTACHCLTLCVLAIPVRIVWHSSPISSTRTVWMVHSKHDTLANGTQTSLWNKKGNLSVCLWWWMTHKLQGEPMESTECVKITSYAGVCMQKREECEKDKIWNTRFIISYQITSMIFLQSTHWASTVLPSTLNKLSEDKHFMKTSTWFTVFQIETNSIKWFFSKRSFCEDFLPMLVHHYLW